MRATPQAAPPEIREWIKIFASETRYRYHDAEFFGDWLTYCLWRFWNPGIPPEQETIELKDESLKVPESQHKRFAENKAWWEDGWGYNMKKYGKKELVVMEQLFRRWIDDTHTGICGAYGWSDMLGEYYQFIASQGKASAMGQFFTPQTLCEVMARIIQPGYRKFDVQGIFTGESGEEDDGMEGFIERFAEFAKELNREPFDLAAAIKVSEPCAGSGRNVLAAHAQNPRPSHPIFFSAIDLDPLCVKMTLLNFQVHGVWAEVLLGNTLSWEFREAFRCVPLAGFTRIKVEETWEWRTYAYKQAMAKLEQEEMEKEEQEALQRKRDEMLNMKATLNMDRVREVVKAEAIQMFEPPSSNGKKKDPPPEPKPKTKKKPASRKQMEELAKKMTGEQTSLF
jgi:hypothetical protein